MIWTFLLDLYVHDPGIVLQIYQNIIFGNTQSPINI